ncbi:hypothetical protein K1719_019562 [Acacia pycnantha]|nr:hypothetical protein K1719_019562 [Acacia pycnantha]
MAWRHLVSQACRYQSQYGHIKKGLFITPIPSLFTEFESRSGNRFLCPHSHNHVLNLAPQVRDVAEDLKEHVRKPTNEEGGNLKERFWHKFGSLSSFFRQRIGMNEKWLPKLSDVICFEPAKAELEKILHSLQDAETFTPKGVLLVVPPYTERTKLARAIAGEAGLPVFSCTEESKFKDIFAAAKERSPGIIFIDEIDTIGGRELGRLVVELDGLERNKGVVVIAATSFPRSLEKAFWKHGRFDHLVVLPNSMTAEGRHQILDYHMSKVLKADDVDLMVIARGTRQLSDAELEILVNLASLKAKNDGAEAVRMADLEYAMDKIYFVRELQASLFRPIYPI